MDYVDIVTKIENKEPLSSNDVTGIQLMNLLRQKVIKDIVYKGTKYEINFVPITFAFTAITVTEETYPKFRDAEKLIEHFIHCYDAPTNCYIQLNNEYYKIILEVLETP
jgi:hypothetical protein